MALAVSTTLAAATAFGGLATSGAAAETGRNLRTTVSFKAGSVGNAFGLKAANSRLTCTAYTITLKTPTGEKVFECADDTYILDAAESAGADLPYSCRAGACCSCAGRVILGEVDQSDGSFLDDEQIQKGYLLTCISYPMSDCVIETHQEDQVV
ncbi:hypothetical protein Mapa_001935 [Marchantia paleacea]|nr:hypothetical protein Mapa_001935 [Marchantia paleacea]